MMGGFNEYTPLDLSDERVERMDRVATLYGEITSATRAFLAALVECERHRDWAAAGFGSCAEWLAWRIGVTRNTANEKVRAALALEELPAISESMARGEISYSKVRALTRVATRENEAELLGFARGGSAANLERFVRSWRDLDRRGEAVREQRRHGSRRFAVVPDGEGMYTLHGRLDPEVAALLMRAIEAASDALFASERGADVDTHTEPQQRRADALGLLAERALAAGFGESGAAPVSGARAERYQLVVYVDGSTLSEDQEPGRSELDDGTRVSAETARRLACDCRRTIAETDGAGGVPSLGRRTRVVSSRLRRMLEIRDRGCRFPGCGLRFTDAHHIRHWADGGRTDLHEPRLALPSTPSARSRGRIPCVQRSGGAGRRVLHARWPRHRRRASAPRTLRRPAGDARGAKPQPRSGAGRRRTGPSLAPRRRYPLGHRVNRARRAGPLAEERP